MRFEIDIEFAFTLHHLTLMLDTRTGEYTIQRRDQNQCKNGRYRQTANYGNCHRAPHFRTLSTANCHRNHTENGCGSSHQYRTKTTLTGGYYRVQYRLTAFTTQRKLMTLNVLLVKNKAINTPLNANGRENIMING